MLNNILISRQTREVINKDEVFIGMEGENLQEVLVFNLDEELEGSAIVEILFPDESTAYIEIEKTERGYELPVKSSLLTQDGIVKMQLRIIQAGQEIFKSELIRFKVKESINATTTIPEEYPTWIDNIETLKIELQDAENQRATAFIQMQEDTKTAINNIEDMTEEYNANAEEKTDEFDAHVGDKIKEYDEHTEELTNRLDGIDEKDTNQDKLIEELQTQVVELETENENIKNQFPTGQAEGENITLTDSSDMPFKLFRPGGNSWQATRSGKNKINLNKPANLNEASIKLSEDVLTVSSTATNTTPYVGYLFEDLKTGDIIRLNGIILDAVGRIVRQVYKDNSWISVETIVYTDGSSTASSSYTVPDGINSVRYLFYSSKTIPTADSSSRYKNIILTINDSDMTYEPYGAMPSPEFRSEIRNVGDNVNLFDKDKFLENYSGVTGEGVDGGHKYISYTTSDIGLNPFMENEFEENTQYTISFLGRQSVKSVQGKTTGFAFKYSDGTSSQCYIKNDEEWKKYILTSDKNKTIVAIRMLWQYGGTVWFSDIKLEKGAKSTSCSPYNCGNFDEIITNENMLYDGFAEELVSRYSKTDLVSIIELNEKRFLYFSSIAGSANDYKYIRHFIKGVFEENTQYTFAGKLMVNQEQKQTNLRFVYTDGTYQDKTLTSNAIPNTEFDCVFTSIAGKTIESFCMAYASGSTYIDLSTATLVKGTSTEYIPNETQQITFPLSEGQRMYKDSYLADDGIHYERKNRLFNGTENWFLNTTTNDNFYFWHIPYIYLNNMKAFGWKLSDKFKVKKWVDMPVTEEGLYCATEVGVIALKKDRCEHTVEALKAWLSENPFLLEYELIEEEIELYTEEQQLVYNEIKKAHSYKNVTHIFSTDEIKPVLDVTYRKDLETMFNNINTAIVSLGGV